MTDILTSDITEAMTRLAAIEHDPAKRAQIINAATQAHACGGGSFLGFVDVFGRIMASGRITSEDLYQIHRRGIDIGPAVRSIQAMRL